MKIVVDVPKTNFKKNDLLIYDGSKWYTVKKEDLFAEFERKYAEAVTTYDRKYQELEKDFVSFKSEITEQISDLAKIIKNLIVKEN